MLRFGASMIICRMYKVRGAELFRVWNKQKEEGPPGEQQLFGSTTMFVPISKSICSILKVDVIALTKVIDLKNCCLLLYYIILYLF